MCVFSIPTTPCDAAPGAHSPHFTATRLLKPFPFLSSLSLSLSFFFFFFFRKTEFTHPALFSLLQFIAGLFHPPSPSHPSLFLSFPLSVPRSLSYPPPPSPPLSRIPPPLSEEIDWVIWRGASSARFLAWGGSGGDMTTCRNNNNTR